MVDAAGDRRRGLIVRSGSGEILAVPEPIDLSGVVLQSQIMPDGAEFDPVSVLQSAEAGQRLQR